MIPRVSSFVVVISRTGRRQGEIVPDGGVGTGTGRGDGGGVEGRGGADVRRARAGRGWDEEGDDARRRTLGRPGGRRVVGVAGVRSDGGREEPQGVPGHVPEGLAGR